MRRHSLHLSRLFTLRAVISDDLALIPWTLPRVCCYNNYVTATRQSRLLFSVFVWFVCTLYTVSQKKPGPLGLI